jgi:hypothetical protein
MIHLQADDGEINALLAIFDRAFKNQHGGGMDCYQAIRHWVQKIEDARPTVAMPSQPKQKSNGAAVAQDS